MRSPLVRALLLAALSTGLATASWAESADQGFRRLADGYLDGWLERRPQLATRLGVHAHDRELQVVTQATLAGDAAWLHDIGPGSNEDRDCGCARGSQD